MQIRVPIDVEYTSAVGKAIYIFAYFEWAIIYVIDHFCRGYLAKYCRGKPATSGAVKLELDRILANKSTNFGKVSRDDLQKLCDRFGALIEKRNALIHGHPITDTDGSQILNYQGRINKPLPDMKWPLTEVIALLHEFDTAACDANDLLHRLL